MPTRALWELEHDPEQMALRILTLRTYAATKERVDRAKTSEDMPTGALASQVIDIEAELVQEEVEAAVAERLATLEDDDEE